MSARRRSSAIVGDGHSEHKHQAELISWSRASARLQSDLSKRFALEWLHSIPNASDRIGFKNRAGKWLPSLMHLKRIREGLTAGVCDVRLDYVVRDSDGRILQPGLVAEFKRPGEQPTDKQREYMAFAESQGFAVFLWYGWERAALDVAKYMALDVFAPVFYEVQPKRFKTINCLPQVVQLGL